jgi:hypothetical protein
MWEWKTQWMRNTFDAKFGNKTNTIFELYFIVIPFDTSSEINFWEIKTHYLWSVVQSINIEKNYCTCDCVTLILIW